MNKHDLYKWIGQYYVRRHAESLQPRFEEIINDWKTGGRQYCVFPVDALPDHEFPKRAIKWIQALEFSADLGRSLKVDVRLEDMQKLRRQSRWCCQNGQLSLITLATHFGSSHNDPLPFPKSERYRQISDYMNSGMHMYEIEELFGVTVPLFNIGGPVAIWRLLDLTPDERDIELSAKIEWYMRSIRIGNKRLRGDPTFLEANGFYTYYGGN